MSELQRKWAKAKLQAMPEFNELDEGRDTVTGITTANNTLSGWGPIPEQDDDSSSSASSVSSTGTVVPSPNRALFARPLG